MVEDAVVTAPADFDAPAFFRFEAGVGDVAVTLLRIFEAEIGFVEGWGAEAFGIVGIQGVVIADVVEAAEAEGEVIFAVIAHLVAAADGMPKGRIGFGIQAVVVVAQTRDEGDAASPEAEAVLCEDAELVNDGIGRIFFVAAARAAGNAVAGVALHVHVFVAVG